METKSPSGLLNLWSLIGRPLWHQQGHQRAAGKFAAQAYVRGLSTGQLSICQVNYDWDNGNAVSTTKTDDAKQHKTWPTSASVMKCQLNHITQKQPLFSERGTELPSGSKTRHIASHYLFTSKEECPLQSLTHRIPEWDNSSEHKTQRLHFVIYKPCSWHFSALWISYHFLISPGKKKKERKNWFQWKSLSEPNVVVGGPVKL